MCLIDHPLANTTYREKIDKIRKCRLLPLWTHVGFFLLMGVKPPRVYWINDCRFVIKKEVNIFHSLFWRKKYISFLCLRMTVAMLHPKLCIYVYFHPIKEKKNKVHSCFIDVLLTLLSFSVRLHVTSLIYMCNRILFNCKYLSYLIW